MRLCSTVTWVLLILLCFAGINRPLWTPDEPREAEISREMALSASIIPQLGGVAFCEKPPLYYGLVAAIFHARGSHSAEAARFVSMLAGLLTLVILFLWGRQAAGRAIGWIAIALLGTSAQFLLSTHWIRPDALLMLWCTLAFWASWQILAGARNARVLALLYGTLVLALWTKGLVGPVVVAAGVSLAFFVEREDPCWQRLHPVLGVGVLAAALLLLGALIYLEGGMNALRLWAWDNHVLRFVSPAETGHRQSIAYYLPRFPLALSPWVAPFAFVLTRAFWQDAEPRRARIKRFAGALCAGGLLVLSASASKREIYLLPILPPAALLLALSLQHGARVLSHKAHGGIGWSKILAWLQMGASTLWAILPGVALLTYLGRFSASAALSVFGALACALTAAIFLYQARYKHAFTALALSAGVGAASLLLLVAPVLNAKKDFTPFITEMDQWLSSGEAVYAIGVDETLLGIVPFLTGRQVIAWDKADFEAAWPEGAVSTGLATSRPSPHFLLVQSKTKPERVVSPTFEMVHSATVGNKRRLTLWRRTPFSTLEKGP